MNFFNEMKINFSKGASRAIPTLLAGAAAVLLWSAPAAAQNLDLFEDVEQTSPASNRRASSSNNSATASLSEPEFVLVGTSRIGDRQRVVLTHRSGETVSVPVAGNGQAAIPGHEQFRIVTNEGGRVAIQYPAGSTCVAASARGVSCDDNATIAWLALRPAPVPEQYVVDLNADANADAAADADVLARDAADALERNPDNPFARRRAEALGQDVPPAPRFRPRRIDPTEIPAGMRVVSTPFGDRLVEIQ